MSSQNTTAPRLLTEREAAERLGLAIKTLQRWRSQGFGPAVLKLGRAVRYDPADIAAFIVASRAEGAQ